jgi:RTX calcium-binding nonapeptide repeat (4 copies)
MATAAEQQEIIQLVVGMVGAAPGADILAALEAELDAGATIAQIADAIVANPVYDTIYASSLSNSGFATAFLTDYIGNEVSAENLTLAIDAVTALLNAGETRGATMAAVFAAVAAVPTDDPDFGAAAQAQANRVEVATYYSVTKGLSSESLTTLTSVVSAVGSDADSLTAGLALVDELENAGDTFALTTAADTLTGGALNDTFEGSVSALGSTNTLNSTDTLDGGEGTADVLKADLAANFTGFTTGGVTNVEKVSLTNTGVVARNFDASGVVGATTYEIEAERGVNLTDIESGVSNFMLTNVGNANSVAFSTAFVTGSSEVTGTSDAADLAVTNVGKVSATAPKIVTATMNSFETVNLDSSGANWINFGGTTLKTLNVAGDGYTVISTVPTSLTAFDASAATGTVSATLTAVTGLLTTIATGSGDDSLTIGAADAAANATLSGGAGADTLKYASTGGTVQYTMTGFETLALGAVTGALTFAGTNSTGLTDVTSTSTATAATGLVNMGASDLTFKSTDATVDGGDISSDHTGSTTLNYTRGSTGTAAKTVAIPDADYTFSAAAGALTVNNNAYITTTAASTVTAAKASSLTVNVESGKDNSTIPAEVTSFGGVITAASATEVNVNATGALAASAAITAAKAKSATITNGSASGTLNLTAAAVETLNVTTGNGLAMAASTLTGVQTANISVAKGTFTAGALTSMNDLNISGAGSTSAANIGALGSVTQDYALSVNATGLKGGLTLSTLDVNTGFDISLDVSGVTGAVTTGTIGTAAEAENVTVNAMGVDGAVTFGAITGAGDVNVLLDGTVGVVTLGAISGKTVTVDASDTIGGVATSTYSVTAGTTADVAVSSLEASTVNITAAAAATSNTSTVTGGILVDAVSILNGGATTVKTITLSGDLGLGADTVTIDNSAYATGTTGAVLDISGVLNYATSTLTSPTIAATTITGGAGADTITAGVGVADTIVGGGGADVIVSGTGNFKDTITGGSGADTFNQVTAQTAVYDHITDFVGGVDEIKTGFAGAAVTDMRTTSTTGAANVAAAGQIAATAAIALAATNYDGAGDTILFTFGSKTYLAVNEGANGTVVDGTDVIVEVTGITGTLVAGDIIV